MRSLHLPHVLERFRQFFRARASRTTGGHAQQPAMAMVMPA